MLRRETLALSLGAALLWPAWISPHAAAARTVAPVTAHPAPVFRPILPQLAHARMPVYLPSWLPAFPVRVYPFAGVSRGGKQYSVYLSTRRSGGADANLVFTLDATAGPPDTAGRKVALERGIVAHIDPHTGGNRGPTISWAVGGYSYEIGYLYPERKLIRAARSMVAVRFSAGHLDLFMAASPAVTPDCEGIFRRRRFDPAAKQAQHSALHPPVPTPPVRRWSCRRVSPPPGEAG